MLPLSHSGGMTVNETFDDLDLDLWPLNESLLEMNAAFCCFHSQQNESHAAFWKVRQNTTAHLRTLDVLRDKLNNVIVPLICLFGIVGNSFSIYVFSRRWLTKYIDQLERSALTGLVSLAVSDLAFCLISVPALFFRTSTTQQVENSAWNVLALYYKYHRSALTNLFLLNSTWIIVVISLERFVAVSYAFRARWLIRVRVTIIVHVTVFLASFAVCLPLMLRVRVHTVTCPRNSMCVYVTSWTPFNDHGFRLAYKVLWATVGTFVPLSLLVATSVRLLVDLYRSKAFGLADPDRYCTPQITTMVAAILLTFVALVCPSMIVECLGWTWFSREGRGGDGGHSRHGDYLFWQAMLVANLLQTVKFASNFLLYCAVSREFRKNFNFRCLGGSLKANVTSTTTTTSGRKRMTMQRTRTTDGSSASACQLIALQSQSKTSSTDGRKESTK